MRKFLKRVVVVILAFVVLTAVVVVILVLTIDKEWIEARLQDTLSRRVLIGKLSTRLFSPISGFQVTDLKISNRLSPQELASMKQITANRLFIQARMGTMKFSLLPLLRRKLKIRKIVLLQPQLHLRRHRDGSFNFSDLLDDEESFFKQISVAALTIRDGHLTFADQKTGNRFSLNDFSITSEHSGKPGGTEKQDKLDVASTFKLQARQLRPSSFARSADIVLRINGTIQSIVEPDSPTLFFDLNIHTVEGKIQGFKIMERIKSLPVIHDYLDGLNFLTKDFTWKEGSVRIAFKKGLVDVTGGEIRALNHSLKYDGQFQPNSGQMSMKVEFIFPQKYKEVIRKRLLSNINRLLPARLKQSVDQAELVERVISPLFNRKGQLILIFALKGTPGKPIIKLIKPTLQPFSKVLIDLVKKKISTKGRSLFDQLLKKVLKKKGTGTK